MLLISDSPDVDASARSQHRATRRWSGMIGTPPSGGFTGDPTDPSTFRWTSEARAVSAIVHLRNDERAALAVAALRQVRPDAAVFVLSEAVDHAPGDGTLTRAGPLRDVLRLDLEDELVRLEAQRRAWCIRQFAEPVAVIPLVVHPDPDPDALSSAYAMRVLLGRDNDTSPIMTTAAPRRPENRRMAKLLGLDVVETEGSVLRGYERLIVLDMQPSAFGTDAAPRFAVIDHHPAEPGYRAEQLDVRPEYGAVATIMTEYLRAHDPALIDATTATALLYGIKTDTDSLTRGVAPPDVMAYAFLQSRADSVLLRRMQRPAYPVGAARSFGTALSRMRRHEQLNVAFAGELDEGESHILADLADFCMDIEDTTRAVAGGIVDGALVLTLRDIGAGDGVGEIARTLAERGGTGGGHPTMARVVLPLSVLDGWREECPEDYIMNLLLESALSPRS